MWRLVLIITVTVVAPAIPLTADFQQASTAAQTHNEGVVVLVRFTPETSIAERDALIAQSGGQLLGWLAPLNVAQVQMPANDAAVQSAAAQFATTTGVQWFEYDDQVTGVYMPNDPDLVDPYKVYAPQLLNLFTAWSFTTGDAGVKIAILDTGLNHAHPEFAGRILPGYDIIHQDEHPEDDHGHGTHLAGIVAAAIDNNSGSAGVCPDCSLLPVKVLNQNNQGTWYGVASGLVWAVDAGADIVVMSLGSVYGSQLMADAVHYANDHDVLLVAAAGNNNSDKPFYPAAYPGVLGVGATTRSDQKWRSSNYGDYIDVSAPGDAIYSTYLDLDNEYQGHIMMSGTSMSTPFVAGLAGLLLSQAPERTAADLERLITTTAYDLGDPGRDDFFGSGRIDPVAALQMEADEHPPLGTIQGLVWGDVDYDSLRTSTDEAAPGGVEIILRDASGHITGLAVPGMSGSWTMTAVASHTYTVEVRFPGSLIATTPYVFHVDLEPDASIIDLNVGLAPRPSPENVRELQAHRESVDAISLHWSITGFAAREVVIERAASQNGAYTPVGSVSVQSAAGASERRGDYVDYLPLELSTATVYYRLRLWPGDVTSNVISVAPLQNVYVQFLPTVMR